MVKKPYTPRNPVRMVTATSLFDGHDAAINIMRRLLQSTGVEVIHLGHNRSAVEIVDCAIQEDVQGIAVTSYQGGHMEFYAYIRRLLDKKGANQIKLFGGGGGVILPDEIAALASSGTARIFSPDDGRKMGLQGMINEVVKACDFKLPDADETTLKSIKKADYSAIARLITTAENKPGKVSRLLESIELDCSQLLRPVIGITGTGGSGKSSLMDEIVRRYLTDFPAHKIGIISVDPTKRKTGGALLGDRIRMNAIRDPRVYMRSMATRRANFSLSEQIQHAICILKAAGFHLILLETSGIGQADTEVVEYCDIPVYIMTPEYGAATQLEKIEMLDFAELTVVNKSDKPGAPDALRDVRKQYQRNHNLFQTDLAEMPVFGTVASDFNDPGLEEMYKHLLVLMAEKSGEPLQWTGERRKDFYTRSAIIPGKRVLYLSDIAEEIRNIYQWIEEQAGAADRLYGLQQSIDLLQENEAEGSESTTRLKHLYRNLEKELDRENREILRRWKSKKAVYSKDKYNYMVRGRRMSVKTRTETLSHLKIPKVALEPERKCSG